MALRILSTFSYLALLLLIMPATLTGLVQTLLLSAAGVFLMIYKKPKLDFTAIALSNLLPDVCIAACLGYTFFKKWLPSSKVGILAEIFHITPELLLILTTAGLSICASVILLCAIDHIFRFLRNTSKNSCPLLTAIATVVLSQFMIEVGPLAMGVFHFSCGVLIVYLVIEILYCLSGRNDLSIILGTSIFLILSTINVYVYRFRGRLLEPIDLFSANTAINVADNYALWPIPATVGLAWFTWAGILLFIATTYAKRTIPISHKGRKQTFVRCVIGCILVFVYTLQLNTYHWDKEAAQFNGYILDFVSKLKEAYISEPHGYHVDTVNTISQKYRPSPGTKRTPNIIVIMDEAFSDLSVLGNISTDQEVTPFISSLKENTVSGYALTSVYGGNTANSEYEFLTGNTMAWLSPNVVPYQQYIHGASYSMVSYLKEYHHYNCIAIHPYLSNGWNRPETYKNFGFDRCLFLEDFPQNKTIRNYVSDQEMFEKIIELYENSHNQPLFLFGITMQNHGGYGYSAEDFKETVSLIGYKKDYYTVNQYLSLIHETDKAVAFLLSYFSNVDEDVVVVFFGDHQPWIEEAFYEEIGATAWQNLDVQQNRYKVPFFIWTNYESEPLEIACTSLNYLSTYVYQQAQIALPPYNQFLSELEEKVPAINTNGFYSLTSNSFLPLNEAVNEEKEWLQTYEILQYNNIFDNRHRNQTLFITTE